MLAPMKDEPNPAILAAVEAGRGEQGGTTPAAWVRLRARVLTAAQAGLTRARLGGELGLSEYQATKLLAEGCDAVMRGEQACPEADRACAERWRRACHRGDQAACARGRQMAERVTAE
jgi:hypothetical protein